MQTMENFVKKLQLISDITGTMFQLEGTPRNMKISVKVKKDALQLQLTPEPLVLYVRERIRERFVRTPNPITEDQLTYLETLLGVKIIPFKTYFLNQIFPK